MTDKQFDPWKYIPESYIKRDKAAILKFYNDREKIRISHRRLIESKGHADAVLTIKHLIDKWKITVDELFEGEYLVEGYYFEDEEPYGTDKSEEGLVNSKRMHDLLDIDYKCKVCVVRSMCCKFNNAERLERNKECDGVSYLLNSYLADDVAHYYLENGCH
jgi:hypothetical protein